MNETKNHIVTPYQIVEHHMIPRSRGGGRNGNIKKVPHRIHEAWHFLFGVKGGREENMLPHEVERLLRSGAFQFRCDEDYAAWKLVFGALTNPLEAAEIVRLEWTP